jgi:predicted TIM-barrel fold metal-dependent hydrolase
MLYAGTLYRAPGLRLIVAGSDAGWVPNWFEGVDNNFMRTVGLRGYQLEDPAAAPSDYFRKHFIYTSGSTDSVAVRFRRYVGPGHIMWASNFPRAEGDWPNNRTSIDRLTRGMTDDDRKAFLAGNAARMYRLTGWEAMQSTHPEPVKLPHMLTAPVP